MPLTDFGVAERTYWTLRPRQRIPIRSDEIAANQNATDLQPSA
ncbi:hypothetical protein [Synechococcus sp. MIT S1220]